MSNGHFEIASEVEDIKVAVVVDSGEQTGVSWMPVDIVDVVLGVFEGAEGVFGVRMPKLDSPVVGTSEDKVIEQLELRRIVDG